MMEVRVGKQTTEIFFKLGGKSFTATTNNFCELAL